jgi:hypothetical protein
MGVAVSLSTLCGQQMRLCVVLFEVVVSFIHCTWPGLPLTSTLKVDGGASHRAPSRFHLLLHVLARSVFRVRRSVRCVLRTQTHSRTTHTLAHTHPPGGTTPSLNVVAFSPTDTPCALVPPRAADRLDSTTTTGWPTAAGSKTSTTSQHPWCRRAHARPAVGDPVGHRLSSQERST